MAEISVLTGYLSADPQYTESEKGGFWKLSIPEKKNNDVTLWYNCTSNLPANHPVLSRCKKGSSIVATCKVPYTVNEYTFVAYDKTKNSASCQKEVIDITFGSSEKKAEGENKATDSPDSFYSAPKPDNLVPKDEFSIPSNEPSRPGMPDFG